MRCHHCGKLFRNKEDKTYIGRAGFASLYFHTECFRKIAGDEYVPLLNTDYEAPGTFDALAYAMAAAKPSRSNIPDLVATKQDLQKYINYATNYHFEAIKKNPDGTALAIKTDLQGRVPMGIKIDVNITRDSLSAAYQLNIRYTGTDTIECRALISNEMFAY